MPVEQVPPTSSALGPILPFFRVAANVWFRETDKLGLGILALAEPLPEFPTPGCSFRVAIIGASRSISEQGVTAARMEWVASAPNRHAMWHSADVFIS